MDRRGRGGDVLLHCNGELLKHSKDGKTKERVGEVANILMARNGAWLEFGNNRMNRDVKGAGHWQYSHDEFNAKAGFEVHKMKFFISAETATANIYHYLYCFPITNPFLPYVE